VCSFDATELEYIVIKMNAQHLTSQFLAGDINYFRIICLKCNFRNKEVNFFLNLKCNLNECCGVNVIVHSYTHHFITRVFNKDSP
jgi:hypothetical protein